MDPRKVKSIAAETSEKLESDAAVKIFPARSLKSSAGGPIDKDGEGGGSDSDVDSFVIDIADNGFVLIVNCFDGLQEKTIHNTIDEVFDAIRKRF